MTTTPLPDGSCDCHAHVFAAAATARLADPLYQPPPDSSIEQLRRLHHRLGFTRGVIVQPLVYGCDHGLVRSALEACEGAYRGVALLQPERSVERLEGLAEAGFCAGRVHLASWQEPRWDAASLRSVGAALADLGWHLEVHVDGPGLERYGPTLAAGDVTVVVDHMGNMGAPSEPMFRWLLGMASSAGWFVKVSGIDRCSPAGRPWRAGLELLEETVEAVPQQVVWGTDWPHTEYDGSVPDDAELLALFRGRVGDSLLRRILVDTPARLYGWDIDGRAGIPA